MKKNPYEAADSDAARPESIWVNANTKQCDEYYNKYTTWWANFYQYVHQRKSTSSEVIHAALGNPSYNVTYRHRNDVWRNDDEFWVLFVDTRGPAFCVTEQMSGSDAFAAFESFTKRINAYMKQN